MNHRIELGHEETDIDIVLPNGKLIQIQYRLMSPSIDICLPAECEVANYIGDDMDPSPSANFPHVRLAKQLVVDLNPEWTKH